MTFHDFNERMRLARRAERFAHLDAIPEAMRDMTLDGFTDYGGSVRTAKAAAAEFAAKPTGWVVFVGDPGVGKTHLAVAIAQAVARRVGGVGFHVVPQMLDYLRSSYEDRHYADLFDYIRSARLCVLDDLSLARETAWAWETMYKLIDYRYSRRLPTVITANVLPSGDRDPIASRLGDVRLVRLVPIVAPDHRRQRRSQ